MQPSWKRLLWIAPGVVLAITGLILFVVLSNDDNYWYLHSLWHILMATSILFFLPKKIRKIIFWNSVCEWIFTMLKFSHKYELWLTFSLEENQRRKASNETVVNGLRPSLAIVNNAAVFNDDEIDNINTTL